MFGKRAAQTLDNTARAIHEVGTNLAGETGGQVADAIVNTTLGPIRSRIDEACTCGTNCEH